MQKTGVLSLSRLFQQALFNAPHPTQTHTRPPASRQLFAIKTENKNAETEKKNFPPLHDVRERLKTWVGWVFYFREGLKRNKQKQ
jgi:hypothetical protein